MLIIRVITIWPPHHGDSLEETWSVKAIQAIRHYPLPPSTIMMMITRRKLIFTTTKNRQVNKAYFLLEFLRKDDGLGVRPKYADANSSTGRAEWKRQFMSGKMRADTQKSARIGANLSIVSLQISPEPGSHRHQFGFFWQDQAFLQKWSNMFSISQNLKVTHNSKREAHLMAWDTLKSRQVAVSGVWSRYATKKPLACHLKIPIFKMHICRPCKTPISLCVCASGH